ncbi:MAG TPA: Rrf2 family transcriptional regulator [Anaeromyxobacteraceae bacterium]|nr:Rrf2 family transcriptional regulator [Anaeromyxobacteraceae bacterium]
MVRPSRKADYALRASLDLALNAGPERLVRTSEIARRTGTPSKFLEAILSQLGAAGLVQSQRGARGGHRLARAPSSVTVGDVLQVAGGVLPARVRPPRPGDGPGRAVDRLWEAVEKAVQETVEGVTLEDLARQAQRVSSVPDYSI